MGLFRPGASGWRRFSPETAYRLASSTVQVQRPLIARAIWIDDGDIPFPHYIGQNNFKFRKNTKLAYYFSLEARAIF
jgi:hypothetical protein